MPPETVPPRKASSTAQTSSGFGTSASPMLVYAAPSPTTTAGRDENLQQQNPKGAILPNTGHTSFIRTVRPECACDPALRDRHARLRPSPNAMHQPEAAEIRDNVAGSDTFGGAGS
jgi:hypothetical protein